MNQFKTNLKHIFYLPYVKNNTRALEYRQGWFIQICGSPKIDIIFF